MHNSECPLWSCRNREDGGARCSSCSEVCDALLFHIWSRFRNLLGVFLSALVGWARWTDTLDVIGCKL
jgi:hypothetical protein